LLQFEFTTLMTMDDIERWNKHLHVTASVVATAIVTEMPPKKFIVEGHCHNHSNADYNLIVNKID
jgi:hypothetical protein